MKLRKIEGKEKVMENSYAMFQIRQAVGLPQMFFKIGLLKNFANFTGKHPMLESLFDKVAGLKRPATLLKRDSNTVVFL